MKHWKEEIARTYHWTQCRKNWGKNSFEWYKQNNCSPIKAPFFLLKNLFATQSVHRDVIEFLWKYNRKWFLTISCLLICHWILLFWKLPKKRIRKHIGDIDGTRYRILDFYILDMENDIPHNFQSNNHTRSVHLFCTCHCHRTLTDFDADATYSDRTHCWNSYQSPDPLEAVDRLASDPLLLSSYPLDFEIYSVCMESSALIALLNQSELILLERFRWEWLRRLIREINKKWGEKVVKESERGGGCERESARMSERKKEKGRRGAEKVRK